MEYNHFTNLVPTMSVNRIYTAFVQTYDAAFRFQGESHDMWELGYVMEGRAGVTSGNEVYDCGKGDLVIHPSGVFHNVWAMRGEEVRIMTVSFTGNRLENRVPSGKFTLTPAERILMELLEQEIAAQSEGDGSPEVNFHRDTGHIVKNLLEILCLSLHRRRGESAAPAEGHRAALFSEVVTYMQENTDNALGIGDICAACGVGQTVLKELFRTYTGMGVIKYYNHLRVRRAVALISEGHSMAQIAEIMHFSSQNYFSAFFRRETGVSPGRYRQGEEE